MRGEVRWELGKTCWIFQSTEFSLIAIFFMLTCLWRPPGQKNFATSLGFFLYYKTFQAQAEVYFVTPGGNDGDTTMNLYFPFPWILSFWNWALMKPTPGQNCLTSLICALWDKGVRLAGCQFINRPLMNLCHSLQGVLTLLGTCWTPGVEDREFCDICDAEQGAPGVCVPLQGWALVPLPDIP